MLTWVEINKAALIHNLNEFRRLIGNSTLLIPVVKSNAYGHGIVEVASICESSDAVDRLAVVNLDEALLLRLCNIKKPIQILSFFEENDDKVKEAIKKNISFPVYSIKQLHYLNSISKRIGISCKIHIKIDTGTSRVGLTSEEIPEFINEIKKCNKLICEGIWSHFSSSESNSKLTKKQNIVFNKAEKIFNSCGINFEIKHISCTAATVLHNFAKHNAVRVGLGIYGLHPTATTSKKIDLVPVLTWKTKIIQVKNLKKGASISYGGKYIMPKNGKIAILPIGYFDGYDRAWSNKSHVIIRGKKCPVRGRICMNLTIVDVSGLKTCSVGDTVTLIGSQNKSRITVDELAKLSKDTINYEVVTNINPQISRFVI